MFGIIITISLVLGVHRSVLDVLRLAHGDTLSLSLLVKQEEGDSCKTDTGEEGTENAKGGFDTGKIVRLVFVFKEPSEGKRQVNRVRIGARGRWTYKGPIMLPAAEPALKTLISKAFLVWPPVLATIHETIMGLAP